MLYVGLLFMFFAGITFMVLAIFQGSQEHQNKMEHVKSIVSVSLLNGVICAGIVYGIGTLFCH